MRGIFYFEREFLILTLYCQLIITWDMSSFIKIIFSPEAKVTPQFCTVCLGLNFLHTLLFAQIYQAIRDELKRVKFKIMKYDFIYIKKAKSLVL